MNDLINNNDLTRKLNYILKELGMNKKEFQIECQKYNPSISKPTILNMLNGKNTTMPTVHTLATVIKVCQNSNNENLKRVSFNYLLNDGIHDVEAKNTQIFDSLGLKDDTIETLKRLNTDYIPLNKIEIINYYLYHTSYKYWNYLDMLKKSYELKNSLNENNIKNVVKLFMDDTLNGYLQQYFNNVYNIMQNIEKKNNKLNLEHLNNLLDIVITHLKIKLIELDSKLFDSI